MITTMASDSDRPWTMEDPANISQAYDSIVDVSRAGPVEEQQNAPGRRAEVWSSGVGSKVLLRPLKVRDQTALEDLVKLCESGVDLVQHIVLAAPSGPLLGSARAFQHEKALLHRFFAQRFGESALRQYSTRESSGISPTILPRLGSHGTVDLEKLKYTEEAFEEELKRFLVCLMCGTTLTCAAEILDFSDLAMVVTEGSSSGGGEMLALVNRMVLAAADRYELTLGGRGFESFQGFLLLSRTENPEVASIVVGRTTIPTSRF